MSHYDCDLCGTRGCSGSCEDKHKNLLTALDAAGISEKDFYLLEHAKGVLLRNYRNADYNTGIILKELAKRLDNRIQEIKNPEIN